MQNRRRWLCAMVPLAGPLDAACAAAGSIVDVPDDDPGLGAPKVPGDLIAATLMSVIRQRQLNPLRAARLLAAVRVAQAEGLRAVDREDPRVALWAGLQAMSWMLPQESAPSWVGPGLSLLAGDPLPRATTLRVERAVVPVLSRMALDRSDARRRPLKKPQELPGIWQRTPPLFAEQPTEPQAPLWEPWCKASAALDVPVAPRPGSAIWARDIEELWSVARSLTPRQKEVARRWHLDSGSITPPGVWNHIVLNAAKQSDLDLWRRHQVLAAVNMAMQDALVAAWRIKLRDWSERPITALRREKSQDFEPLLVTPPFPGYVSGHATVSAAAAGVLSHFLPDRAGQWRALAAEAAESRLYGGIHFRIDNDVGLQLGLRVAEAFISEFTQGSRETRPFISEPGDTPERSWPLPGMSV